MIELILMHKGMISLCGGLPSSTYFPFSHIDLGLPKGDKFSEEEMMSDSATARIGKHDMRDGVAQFGMKETDLHVGFLYYY